MATDILALARETLALADGATPGPWRYGALEHRGRYVTDGRGYLFAQVDDDGNGRLIAGYREAAPELARFVERVDAVLRDVLDHATGPDPDAPEDEPRLRAHPPWCRGRGASGCGEVRTPRGHMLAEPERWAGILDHTRRST